MNTVTTDTDALLATVREALHPTRHPELGTDHLDDASRNALAALDSLAAELEVLSRKLTREIVEYADTDAELERVKAERDEAQARLAIHRDARGDDFAALVARLDKALSTLREIADGNVAEWKLPTARDIARRAIAEIEGEPPKAVPPPPDPRLISLSTLDRGSHNPEIEGEA